MPAANAKTTGLTAFAGRGIEPLRVKAGASRVKPLVRLCTHVSKATSAWIAAVAGSGAVWGTGTETWPCRSVPYPPGTGM